ncbi:MAG: hypothetical protein N2C12_10025 [Planctomycetales bacterium]
MVFAVEQQDVARHASPLSIVCGQGTRTAAAITAIGMLAGLNGALVQIIMASRVAYGMAHKRQVPKILGRVFPKIQTPLVATVVVTTVVLILTLWLPIVSLARATSTILLLIFATVNLSLVVIKWREPTPPTEEPSFPMWLLLAGWFACLAFLNLHALTLF